MEITVEKGLGYVAKEVLHKDRVDIGTISLDATFTPIRKVNYEVENMRIGDRTDFNRLRISIETDGTITPREALESSIALMISQLKAIIGFKEEEEVPIITEELLQKEAMRRCIKA
jgi:DNA-directed RNA polymerase subunit alpha